MKVSISRFVVFVGLIQIAVYWFLGAMACSSSGIALPQPDTPLYYQAARRIVEGCPFSYSHGSPVCTGTTTVLYPFLLAIPYSLGFTGDAMIVAGFLLNAIFYLVFLLSWADAIDGWCDRNDVKILSALMLSLSGHCAIATFSQTDIGFWLAFTGVFASALSRQRRWLVGILLLLATWVRPEGLILLIAFAMVTLISDLLRKDTNTRLRIVFIVLGFLSACGVFVLNYLLTGHVQFSSISGKGHFATLPFSAAVISSIADFFYIVKEMILGLSCSMPRNMLSVPFFGAVLLGLGVVGYKWSRKNVFGFGVFVLAAVGGVFNVAFSGMQGSGMDRYLIWIIPVCTIFTAHGVCFAEDRMPIHIRRIPSVLVAVFSLIGCIACQCYFSQMCSSVDTERLYSKDCESIMPKGASVGGFPCASSYFFSARRFSQLTGIYSPEFVPQDIMENVERLRHNPESRFEYWLSSADLTSIVGSQCVDVLGEVLLPGPSGMTLMKADWKAFDSTMTSAIEGLNLVAKVDVGYAADESSANYHVITRWGYPEFDSFAQVGKLGERTIIDVGRVILGGDEMSVSLRPGCDVTVVLRLWPKHTVHQSVGVGNNKIDCEFANPLRINISVDGAVVGLAEVSYATNAFSDVVVKIPGSAIKNPVSRIGFLGDHIVFGYWFYQ